MLDAWRRKSDSGLDRWGKTALRATLSGGAELAPARDHANSTDPSRSSR
jgi:hypothetical protein